MDDDAAARLAALQEEMDTGSRFSRPRTCRRRWRRPSSRPVEGEPLRQTLRHLTEVGVSVDPLDMRVVVETLEERKRGRTGR